MNFFEQQDQARQRTKQLLALFAASVLTLIVGIYAVTIVLFGAFLPTDCGSHLMPSRSGDQLIRRPAPKAVCDGSDWVRFRPSVFLTIGAVTSTLIVSASLWKIWQLRAGGSVIAKQLGGRLVTSDSNDESERMLLNVIEEMAIAAGTPVPEVYLLDHESGINAFAAGFTPNDAVIGVTRGCLEQFTRDELQGVIGHEFSHILNGDMRLNITLMGWLHGILCIYLIGRGCLYGSSNRDSDGIDLFVVFGLALIGLGGSGLLFGRLMQSAISRQREFLADASAVQFTRNPQGIASALEKLAGTGSQINASYAQASSHMFFGNVLSRWWENDWFATHPPIAQRIMRVQGLKPGDLAGFSGTSNAPSVTTNVTNVAGVAGFASGMTANSAKPTAKPPAPLTTQSWTADSLPRAVITTSPEQVITQIGSVEPSHYDYVKRLLAQIPTELRSTLRNPQQAPRLIYALMLDRENPLIYQQQVAYLQQVEDPAGIEQVFQLETQIKPLNPRLYLPMLDLAVPALRQKSPQDCQRLLKAVHELAKLDGQWTIGEFVRYLVLQYRLQPHISGQPPQPSVAYKDIAPVGDECLKLLAALAKTGSQDPKAIDFAFRSGLFHLPGTSQNPTPDALPSCNLLDLRQSLAKLRRVSPKLKQGIVDACAHTVMVDNRITLKEADLLRAIVILLDCPMPPFLDHNQFAAA
jgi:Zn-dependent protease with chaperone function